MGVWILFMLPVKVIDLCIIVMRPPLVMQTICTCVLGMS